MPDTSTSLSAPLRPAVVDLAHSTDIIGELHSALVSHGFVAIRNCGVPPELLSAAFTSARSYFAQNNAIKARDAYSDTQANFGYQGLQTEALDPGIQADLKEAFTMRNLNKQPQPSENSAEHPANIEWAATDFGATASQLYRSCAQVSLHLLSLMAEALGAAPNTFEPYHRGENMTLRYLHYPTTAADVECPAPHAGANSAEKDEKKPQLGAGAHTDYGTITLLFSDGVAGLQLFDVSARDSAGSAGRWRDVEVAAGDVLVNTGDLMMLWSNGAYPSTLHRVQPRLGKPERYSMAFFVDPDSATRVSPLPSCLNADGSANAPGSTDGNAHPTSAKVVVAGEHIQARIEASQRTLA